MTVTMVKEAHDDIQRARRDSEVNSQKYTKISVKEKNGEESYI